MKIKRKIMAVCDKLDNYNNERENNGYVEFELTDSELREAYEEWKYEMLLDDARYFLDSYNEMNETDIYERTTDEEIEGLVKRFKEMTEYREDPFTSVWNEIIEEFVEEKGEER